MRHTDRRNRKGLRLSGVILSRQGAEESHHLARKQRLLVSATELQSREYKWTGFRLSSSPCAATTRIQINNAGSHGLCLGGDIKWCVNWNTFCSVYCSLSVWERPGEYVNLNPLVEPTCAFGWTCVCAGSKINLLQWLVKRENLLVMLLHLALFLFYKIYILSFWQWIWKLVFATK